MTIRGRIREEGCSQDKLEICCAGKERDEWGAHGGVRERNARDERGK